MSYLITFCADEPPGDICLDCPFEYFVTDHSENDGRIGCGLLGELIPEEHDVETHWEDCPVTEVLKEMKQDEAGAFIVHCEDGNREEMSLEAIEFLRKWLYEHPGEDYVIKTIDEYTDEAWDEMEKEYFENEST
jgi:hypothetical protein